MNSKKDIAEIKHLIENHQTLRGGYGAEFFSKVKIKCYENGVFKAPSDWKEKCELYGDVEFFRKALKDLYD